MIASRKRASPGVQAEALYLANLLVAPGLAFVLLLLLHRRHRNSADPLIRGHVRQAFAASLAAGLLLLGVTAIIALVGGMDRPGTWMAMLLYFVCCHAALILFGVLGLARALSGKPHTYPLLGGYR